MTKLAETYFRLGIRLGETDKVTLEDRLMEIAKREAQGLFKQSLEFVAYVEDGSIRGWLVAAGSLYIAIGQYGAFRSGLDYAVADARTFSDRILSFVRDSGIPPGKIIRTERRTGIPGKLRRILIQVQTLKASGRDLSKSEYDEELNLLRDRLVGILQLIGDSDDRAFIVENLPRELSVNLPKQLPIPRTLDEVPVALRPQELEFSSFAKSKFADGLSLVSSNDAIRRSDYTKNPKAEPLYQVHLLHGGFKLTGT